MSAIPANIQKCLDDLNLAMKRVDTEISKDPHVPISHIQYEYDTFQAALGELQQDYYESEYRDGAVDNLIDQAIDLSKRCSHP